MDDQPRRRGIQSAAGDRPRLRDRLEPAVARLRSRFAVDTRALAALRVALGLIVLVDLVHRARYLELFYTDDGVYPLDVHAATYARLSRLSIHAVSGDAWVQGLLFALAAAFALALVLGYRTRLVGVVSLVLLYSLHARNPAVLNGGDRLLRVLLLVALLTPLGERWSIDALRRGSARRTVVGVGTVALLAQPLAVFTTNAIRKHRGETWYAGEALQVALANDVMTVFIGNHLRGYPALLEVLTYAWVTLLAGSIGFLLLTDSRLRACLALGYVGAFAGLSTTMAVGIFPLALLASVIPYLTAPFWDTLARLAPSSRVDWRPRLGPLERPPVERRALAALRRRGHGSTASFVVASGRSLLTVAGVAVLCWILLFSAVSVSPVDVPGGLDSSPLNEQRWGLYAPDPSDSYSWYVVEAELANGSSVDALDGGEVTVDRPPDASRTYDSFRHRKYMQSVRDAGEHDGAIATRYADWACERATATADGEVEAVTVHRFLQPSPVDGEFEEPTRHTVVERECGSPSATAVGR